MDYKLVMGNQKVLFKLENGVFLYPRYKVMLIPAKMPTAKAVAMLSKMTDEGKFDYFRHSFYAHRSLRPFRSVQNSTEIISRKLVMIRQVALNRLFLGKGAEASSFKRNFIRFEFEYAPAFYLRIWEGKVPEDLGRRYFELIEKMWGPIFGYQKAGFCSKKEGCIEFDKNFFIKY